MAFSTRYIDEYRAEVRLDIGCPAGALLLWQDTELDRCIQRAVEVLSRFYPQQLAYEHTIDYAVTDEAYTTAAAGTAKALTNKPIRPKSEVVTNAAGTTTYTRDTDYTMDYINGECTTISVANGGSIGDAAGISLLVDYTKSRIGIDISALVADLIRVDRVEYPADKVPQTKMPFNIWGDFLYLESIEPGESQAEWADKEHIVIYYEKKHTAPLVAAAPSYPAFLDEVVCLGAGAYALLLKAVNTEHQSVVDMAAVRTALGLTTDIHTLVNTALGKVATYLETNDAEAGGTDNAKSRLADITDEIAALRNAISTAHDAANSALDSIDITNLTTNLTAAGNVLTLVADYINEAHIQIGKMDTYLVDTEGSGTDNAKDVLANVTDDIGELRTAIRAALECANNYLDEVDTTDLGQATVGAEGLLETGDDTINTINVGDRVPENYREFSQTRVAIATARVNAALGFIQEANLRVSNLRTYMEESAGWIAIANGFATDTAQRMAMAMTYIGEAAQRISMAASVASGERVKIEQAAGYIREADSRLVTVRSYIEEASGWNRIAEDFIAEANARIAEIDRHLTEAAQHSDVAAAGLSLADRFRQEGTERRNEFWATLRDPKQYIGDWTSTSVRQTSK